MAEPYDLFKFECRLLVSGAYRGSDQNYMDAAIERIIEKYRN